MALTAETFSSAVGLKMSFFNPIVAAAVVVVVVGSSFFLSLLAFAVFNLRRFSFVPSRLSSGRPLRLALVQMYLAKAVARFLDFWNPMETSWNEFQNVYLAKGSVVRLAVIDKRWAEAELRHKSRKVWFRIGNVDTFETELRRAQSRLRMKPSQLVPVMFKTSYSFMVKLFFGLIVTAFLLWLTWKISMGWIAWTPGVYGRFLIFRIKFIPVDTNLDKTSLAWKMESLTKKFTNQDIVRLCDFANEMATREASPIIKQKHLDAALEKVRSVRSKGTTFLRTRQAKRLVAVHEAGHTVTAWLLRRDSHPVTSTSIIPIGGVLGITWIKNYVLETSEDLNSLLCAFMGGRAAEKVVFNTMYDGAASDLKQATDLAYKMILQHGFGKKLAHLHLHQSPVSEKTKRLIDKEVKQLITSAMETTTQLLTDNKDIVERVAEALLEKDFLDSDDLSDLIEPRNP